MGTTSEKLTYLNTTKTLIKEELNLGGANITNEPFRAYKSKLEGIYKDFLANGTDTLWNNWEKVSGSGTEISLNNTIEAKMDFVYKGNTSQKTTTGKNLFNSIYYKNQEIYTETISISTGNLYCTKLYLKPNTTYTISEALNNWRLDGGWIFVVADTNNQVIRFLQNRTQDYQTTPTTFTTNSDGYVYIGHRYGFSNGGANRILAFLDTVNIQIEEGNTATSFEEYTGGPSPNPDYPQDIQVVSGDNTIKVEGKNLFNKNDSNIVYNARLTATGTVLTNDADAVGYYVSDFIKVQQNTDMVNNEKLSYPMAVCLYDENKVFISRNANVNTFNTGTAQYLRIGGKTSLIDNKQLEYGSTATTYEPYQGQTYPINLGNIELCKIGDYQDKIAKSTGKNLFDKTSSTVNKYLNSSDGSLINSSTSSTSDYIDIKSSTTYIISGYGTSNYYKVVAYYNSSKTFISANTVTDAINTYSITTPNNAKYLRFHYTTANESQIILNEGTTALPYEPYGKVWYLNKQIGKVVLDGSENWQNQFGESLFGTNLTDKKINANSLSYCNYFNFHNIQSGLNTNLLNGEYTIQIGTTDTFYCKNTNYSNTTDFKTWLNTHNTDVYYVLATPTITEITDTTLISQLEAIKKSYNTQTNISQENNDLPFELDVVALGELEI